MVMSANLALLVVGAVAGGALLVLHLSLVAVRESMGALERSLRDAADWASRAVIAESEAARLREMGT